MFKVQEFLGLVFSGHGFICTGEFLEHFSELNSTEENEAEFECDMNGTEMSSRVTYEYSESET